eukprot:XP_013997273.1 PREDICTED: uncharacterized protein LOC106569983 [Salmo salar]
MTIKLLSNKNVSVIIQIGVDKGVIKQRSTSILCPVSPTLPAFPWYNLHRFLANSHSEPDQHAAGTQKDPSKKHSIFPPLDTQSCTSPERWPHSTSKTQGKEDTDSTQKKRKKKRLNEKGTQVELGMREDIRDLDLAHWRLARETWRTERGNMREIKALYGEIFRLHQLLEEIGVDKGVIKQHSTSILCPVSPTLPAFPWYNLHRFLANSHSEPDQHAAGTQKDPSKKHSIFPPLDTQSCTSPERWPHSTSKTSHPHASHRFAVPSHPLVSGPPARMRQTHPHVHPRSPLTGQAKVKDEVKRPEIASSEELSEEVQRRGAEIANMYKAQLIERMAQKRKEEILKEKGKQR